MTGTPAGQAPTHEVGALPPAYRELLAAISETLTLPAPGGDRTDLARYETFVAERIHMVQLAIRDVLADKAVNGLEWEAGYLRKQNEARPPRYRTHEEYLADLREIARGGEGQ